MDELDFTIEFNSDLNDPSFEENLFAEAESRLRQMARGHDDLTGAAVTIRQPAKKETAPLHEATVVAYVRPDNIVGKEKQDTPSGALKGALDAVERQIRKKREKLRDRWEQPQNDPVTKEVLEVLASEEAVDDIDELLEEENDNSEER
jgi:ribosome-associated translation inhibitor RaiA